MAYDGSTSVGRLASNAIVAGGIVAMLSVIFLEPMAVMAGPLGFSIDRVVAADNVTTVVLAGFALTVRLVTAVRNETHLHRVVMLHRFGELSLLLGLVLHRAFWVPWRVAREYHATAFAVWWESGPVLLTSIGQSCWWLGCVLLCVPQLSRWMPNLWPYMVAVVVPIIWVTAYQAIDLAPIITGWSSG